MVVGLVERVHILGNELVERLVLRPAGPVNAGAGTIHSLGNTKKRAAAAWTILQSLRAVGLGRCVNMTRLSRLN